MRNEQRRQLNDDGFCIVLDVLSSDLLERARVALDQAAELTRQAMGSTHDRRLDPNEANIRAYNLPAADPIFIDLLRNDIALDAAREVLGAHVLVSNFTANIALPGSGSINLHSDQALVVPPPWHDPWAMNIIWCLDDVNEANGATRYLPGSHKYLTFDDVPANAMEKTLAFEAPAGAFIVMEGRLWHTSGKNITANQQRRMLFAYYTTDFIRQQCNWTITLPAEAQAGMDTATRALFGLGPMGNVRIGGALTRL